MRQCAASLHKGLPCAELLDKPVDTVKIARAIELGNVGGLHSRCVTRLTLNFLYDESSGKADSY